jgi:serine/threonine-protein kinase
VNPSTETTVLQLLEQALSLPREQRDAWLAAQDATDEVVARVRHLLDREDSVAQFLEAPPEAASAATSGMLPASGDRLGAWRIERELDAGGMGVVFLAARVDGSYEQHAAIKFIRTDHLLLSAARREESIARFANERRLLARLDHPNVARILDGGSTPAGLPYLVMEYVDGLALNVYCERAALDVAARVALLCKVCDGVQAAHRLLIVHRDLKPQNILVDASGEPRLLDFGIARTLEPETTAPTGTATLAMTPAYASPEQLRLEPLTAASDVYALGVILYELLAGARPYSLAGLSPAQSERVVCDTQPPPLRRALAAATLPAAEKRARLAGVGSDLERIVAQALHKDPARRYDSAGQLAEDLRRQQQGRPVRAHPDSAGYRFTRFVGRHRVASVVATLALTAVLGAGAVALLQAREAGRAAADTQRVNAFLLDVLKDSNPYASGSEITLSQALDNAAAKIDERFDGRPDLAIGVRNALAESLFSRYRLDAAQEQAQRALADGEREFGRDDPRTVQALALLASVRKDQDRHDEAQALFDDALARLERGGQTAAPLYATVLNDLGVMHLVREDFARAQTYLQRAAAADGGSDERAAAEERARTLGNLAQAARGLGELERADALYRQAQPVLEALYPKGGPHLAVILNNRARLAWVRGNKDEAVALQAQAVAMHRRSFAGDHSMVLVPLTNLARQNLDLGRLDAAAEAAGQAVAMADRLYPDKSHPYQVNALAALAGTRLAQGRGAEAADLLQRARQRLASLDEAPASTRDYVATLFERSCAEPEQAATAACITPARTDARRSAPNRMP